MPYYFSTLYIILCIALHNIMSMLIVSAPLQKSYGGHELCTCAHVLSCLIYYLSFIVQVVEVMCTSI